MNEVIEFQSEFGTIYVESNSQPEYGYRGETEENKKATTRFEQALGTIKVVANSVVESIKGIASSPQEVEVKVGLKFTAEAGAIIAKTSTEGNLEITIRWKKEEKNEIKTARNRVDG